MKKLVLGLLLTVGVSGTSWANKELNQKSELSFTKVAGTCTATVTTNYYWNGVKLYSVVTEETVSGSICDSPGVRMVLRKVDLAKTTDFN